MLGFPKIGVYPVWGVSSEGIRWFSGNKRGYPPKAHGCFTSEELPGCPPCFHGLHGASSSGKLLRVGLVEGLGFGV